MMIAINDDSMSSQGSSIIDSNDISSSTNNAMFSL